jgi:hypothetical protein
MTELFTMTVLDANIIVASAFAKFAPTATLMNNLRTPTFSRAGWQESTCKMCVAQSRVESPGPPARIGDNKDCGVT